MTRTATSVYPQKTVLVIPTATKGTTNFYVERAKNALWYQGNAHVSY